MRAGLVLRVLRAMVFAAVAVTLSAAGHLLVTGAALSVASLVEAGAGVFGLALLLTAVQRSFLAIAGVLVPVELGLNALFNMAQHRCVEETAVPHGWTGLLVCGGGSVRPGVLGAVALGSAPGPASLAGAQVLLLLGLHVLVALLAAGWLWRGEIAVFALLFAARSLAWSGLASVLAWLIRPRPVPAAFTRFVPAPEPSRSTWRDVAPKTAPRRGPPAPARA